MNTQYDEDYFMRGKETGKSLYTSYRWMPELTIPMAEAIIRHCKIPIGSRVLDYGCARGYTVRALRGLGMEAFGIDISQWAVENADPEVRQHIGLGATPLSADWIIAKDVLEHIPHVGNTINDVMAVARVGVFVVVPLSRYEREPYVVADYEKDITHIQRWTLATWVAMFLQPGWTVEASYRVSGVKDNYYKPGWETGNGFITARRLKEGA